MQKARLSAQAQSMIRSSAACHRHWLDSNRFTNLLFCVWFVFWFLVLAFSIQFFFPELHPALVCNPFPFSCITFLELRTDQNAPKDKDTDAIFTYCTFFCIWAIPCQSGTHLHEDANNADVLLLQSFIRHCSYI